MRTFIIVTAAVLALAGCTSASPSPSSSASPAASAPASASSSPAPASPSPTVSIKPVNDLSGVKVIEKAVPEVTLPGPWAISKTTIKVLKEGTSSQKVQDGFVQVRYLGVNGRTGKVFDENFSKEPITLQIPAGVIKGFAAALKDQKVGSRVLVGIPSKDGYPTGQPPNILAGDSILFVIDIVAAQFGDLGTTMKQDPKLPTVSLDAKKGPSVSVPASFARPTSTTSHYLIEGSGNKVAADDIILAKFRSFTKDGKVFEDAWASVQSGSVANTIAGFKEGLVGKKTGSRILIVIPASKAYPQGRTTEPKLAADQDLIYVIDVLYAAKK